MTTDQITRLVAATFVGVAAGWAVSKISKPYAAVLGPLTFAIAHQMLDEPVNRALNQAIVRR